MTHQTTIIQHQDFQIDEFYLDLQADGSQLKSLPQEKIEQCPFPGLRPFKTSEQELFYGRSKQIHELVKKLQENKFVAVIGSSGTGKSSLVRAGLIPDIFGGTISGTGSNWKIAICRPGNDPVKNLSISLAGILANYNHKDDLLEKNSNIEPVLRSSSYGIIKFYNRFIHNSTQQKPNLLIIVDQFEELFRFDRKDLKSKDTMLQNIEYDFANLLMQAVSDNNSAIYVVLTMRSEFLGDCVKFVGLPELINKSQYLVPQLRREQLEETIIGPIRRAGKDIETDLVNILINEIENEKLNENLDQLPILQHALMRTYVKAFQNQSQKKVLTVDDYNGIGGMREALANHANEIFDNLKTNNNSNINDISNTGLNRKQLIAKLVFQALTDGFSDQKGGRRPVQLSSVYEILEVLNTSNEEVNAVINEFRDHNTSFIMPPNNTRLYPNLMLDISHESLMRNWGHLKEWMTEEVANAKLYQRLNERREQFETDNETFVKGILLRDLQTWQGLKLHNAAWAARYQKTETVANKPIEKKNLFEKNIAFLEFSKNKNLEEEENLKQKILQEEQDRFAEKERQIKARKNKSILTLAICLALITTCLSAWALFQSNKAKQNEKHATENEEKAKYNENEAKKSAKKAETLLNYAVQERNNARIANQDLTKTLNDLQLSEKSNKQKAEKIAQLLASVRSDKQSLEEKNKDIEANNAIIKNLYAEIKIHNENFYKYLPEKDRKIVMDVLKPLLTNANTTKYDETVRAIDRLLDARSSADYDPNIGLAKGYGLMQADSNKNIISQNILQNIVDSNLFYQDETTFAPAKIGWELMSYNKDGVIIPSTAGACFYYNANNRLVLDSCWSPKQIKFNSVYLLSTRITDQFFDEKKSIFKFISQRGVYTVGFKDNGEDSDVFPLPSSVDSTLAAFDNTGNFVYFFSKTNDSLIRYNYKLRETAVKIPLNNSQQTGSFLRQANRFKVVPNSNLLLIGYRDGTLELWNTSNNTKLDSINYTGSITAIDVSQNGKLCVFDWSSGILHLLDITQNKFMPLSTKKTGSYSDVDISPNGRYILLKGSYMLDLYDTQTGSMRNITKDYFYYYGYSSEAMVARFLNDESALIITDKSSVKLYSLMQNYPQLSNIWQGKNAPFLKPEDITDYLPGTFKK